MKTTENGDTYYSIGALQNVNGVEKWTYTGDRYDIIRQSLGIMFKTKEEALNLLDLIKAFEKAGIT